MKKSFLLFVMSALFAVLSLAVELPSNRLVDVTWLKNNLSNENLVLIMVDRDKTFSKKHIENTVVWFDKNYTQKLSNGNEYHFPTTEQFEKLAQKSGIKDSSIVVFYGAGTDFKNEAKALEGFLVAESYGVNNAVILNGGLAAWEKAGGEVTKKLSKIKKGDFKVTNINEVIAIAEDVQKVLETKDSNIIDARPAKYFTGVDTDKRLQKHGKIDGAVSVQAESLYKMVDGIAYLQDTSTIKNLFQNAGVDLAKPVITYCNTGHLASAPWFAAKHILGMSAKNYKGSMVDYSALPDAKVVKGKL
jgi:thiosulfate/3-mercaptopyruvate sulfurtransferase